jgi:PAS domain-containing protein
MNDVINAISDGILITDRDFNIIFTSKAAIHICREVLNR